MGLLKTEVIEYRSPRLRLVDKDTWALIFAASPRNNVRMSQSSGFDVPFQPWDKNYSLSFPNAKSGGVDFDSRADICVKNATKRGKLSSGDFVAAIVTNKETGTRRPNTKYCLFLCDTLSAPRDHSQFLTRPDFETAAAICKAIHAPKFGRLISSFVFPEEDFAPLVVGSSNYWKFERYIQFRDKLMNSITSFIPNHKTPEAKAIWRLAIMAPINDSKIRCFTIGSRSDVSFVLETGKWSETVEGDPVDVSAEVLLGIGQAGDTTVVNLIDLAIKELGATQSEGYRIKNPKSLEDRRGRRIPNGLNDLVGRDFRKTLGPLTIATTTMGCDVFASIESDGKRSSKRKHFSSDQFINENIVMNPKDDDVSVGRIYLQAY